MGPKGMLSLFGEAFRDWGEDKAERLGAALAYYTIFSIGPLLVVVIAMAGLIFGDAAAQGQVAEQLEGFLGADGAATIQEMIKSASAPTAGIIATGIGVVTLLLGAAGILLQLKGALNTVWEVPPKKAANFLAGLLGWFSSFLMVLLAGLLLALSLIANSTLSAANEFLSDKLPLGPWFWQAVNYVTTLLVLTPVFAAIFKFLPDTKVAWKDVWFGAFITSILFMVGQVAIAVYLSFAKLGTTFGAASSLVVILVWIYYSAQILFFGAELTQVYAARFGSKRGAKEGEGVRRGEGGGRVSGRLAPAHAKASPWFK